MTSFIASLHYLALGIGMGGVFMRGIYMRDLKNATLSMRAAAIRRLLAADNAWGIAALLWIVSGALRAFGGFEKGTAYYLANPLFHLKLGLFVLVFLLELWPMVTFVRWRIRKNPIVNADLEVLPRFIMINNLEILLTLGILIVAPMMARYS